MTFLEDKIIKEDLDEIDQSNIDWSQLENQSILITGAYGMLASYLVYELIYQNEIKNRNITIIALVKNKDKLEKRFKKYTKKPYFKYIISDLTEPIEYNEEINYIIHAASFASAEYYATIPVEVLEPNTIGTYHILNLAKKQKNLKSILYLSTGNIYGLVENEKYLKENNYGTLSTLDPHSCYEESKRMGETICNAYHTQYNLPTKIARIFHAYAPTMNINDPRVFSSFTRDIINNQNIQMKSEGLAKRSFCYITDIITGFLTILLKGKDGEPYNLCNTDQFISIIELAEIMVNIFPEKNLKVIKVKRDKNENYIEYHSNDEIIPCNQKLKDLGWNPKINCHEGFKRVIINNTQKWGKKDYDI